MEQDSQTDGSPSNQNSSNSRSKPLEPPAINRGLLYYDTSKQRHLLIFNHAKFTKQTFLRVLRGRRVAEASRSLSAARARAAARLAERKARHVIERPPRRDVLSTLAYEDDLLNRSKLVGDSDQEYGENNCLVRSDDPLPPRIGTNEDVKALSAVFSSLKFGVTVYDDLSREQIMKVLKVYVEGDHSDTSCVVVAILTHGNLGGELWAKDGPYNLNTILAKFEGGNLVAVPKLFLVQACRGSKTDAGQRIQLDGGGRASITVPTHTDFLILYSTVEDYVSFRDSRGSWMIQTFCRILSQFHHTMDLLHIITLVNHTIAHEYESYSLNPSINDKKQTSETKFTLTKLLKL